VSLSIVYTFIISVFIAIKIMLVRILESLFLGIGHCPPSNFSTYNCRISTHTHFADLTWCPCNDSMQLLSLSVYCKQKKGKYHEQHHYLNTVFIELTKAFDFVNEYIRTWAYSADNRKPRPVHQGNSVFP
jgi:hypothetical protein